MHLTPLGTKDTEGAGKGSLHLKGLQSRAGHSREKHPLVVLGERNSPNLSKRRKRRVQGPRGGARPIKLGKRGGRARQGKVCEAGRTPQCVKESFESFFEQGNDGFGNFLSVLFCLAVTK